MFELGGNPIDARTNTRVFRIDETTGEIFTIVKLDREMRSRYELCIKASNDPDLNITYATDAAEESPGSVARRRRDSTYVEENDDSVLKVVIEVTDVDDHGPQFGADGGSGSRVVTGSILRSVRQW